MHERYPVNDGVLLFGCPHQQNRPTEDAGEPEPTTASST